MKDEKPTVPPPEEGNRRAKLALRANGMVEVLTQEPAAPVSGAADSTIQLADAICVTAFGVPDGQADHARLYLEALGTVCYLPRSARRAFGRSAKARRLLGKDSSLSQDQPSLAARTISQGGGLAACVRAQLGTTLEAYKGRLLGQPGLSTEMGLWLDTNAGAFEGSFLDPALLALASRVVPAVMAIDRGLVPAPQDEVELMAAILALSDLRMSMVIAAAPELRGAAAASSFLRALG